MSRQYPWNLDDVRGNQARKMEFKVNYHPPGGQPKEVRNPLYKNRKNSFDMKRVLWY
jgi:hypothetical protein